MKLNKIALLLILILLLSIISTFFFIKYFLLDSYRVIPIDFKVTNQPGFNADRDALHFGSLVPGSEGFRDFIIHNTNCNKCKVIIKSDMEWVFADKNNFFLNKNESKTVNIYVKVPTDAELGEYNGNLEIYLWKTI